MANPDRPNGFKPVKTVSGAPISGMMRSIGVTDGADIFVGDLLTLTAGLAAVAATTNTAFLGVALGFGKVDKATGEFAGAYNPDDLTKLYYDDSASIHTEWRVFYLPAEDAIFEVQSALDLDLSVGSTADLSVAIAGNTTTGVSGQEITTSVNTDVVVVEIPAYPDNDPTLINTRYWVQTITSAFGQ